MSKKINRLLVPFGHTNRRGRGFFYSTRLVAFACLVAVGSVVGIVQQVYAISADDYCAKYENSVERNACIDATRDNVDDDICLIYAELGESFASICREAKKGKDSGEITNTPTFNPSNPCRGFSGDLYTACNTGALVKKCEIFIADTDVEFYNACAEGAGLSPISVPPEATDPPPNTTNTPSTYRDIINDACTKYKDRQNLLDLCTQSGGLKEDGTQSKPLSAADCITNSDLKSLAQRYACLTGAVSGQNFLTSIEEQEASDNLKQLKLQDQLDQSASLDEFIDLLHKAGPDADVDTSEIPDGYGYYINGAGKKQDINVYFDNPAPNSPAILFFNGGGWHQNDGVGKQVSEGHASDTTGGGNFVGPTGGGAAARGFTTIDVTYRLGSSGVYYMFEDVMRGVASVIKNAHLYGVDPAKIAVWGDSAGGSLSMRVAASGKSGAKAAVGWSAPTNGYTALFRSFYSFLIGMDHSTCIPTDLAGLTNFTDLLTGGSGDVAEYGQGLSSNDVSSLGINLGGGSGPGGLDFNADRINPLGLLTETLVAGQNLLSTGRSLESISSQIESGGLQSLSGGVINLATKKIFECLDNFKALSPALYASPESTPSFLAGFENDNLVGPGQAYDMRDKLRSLGIRSAMTIIPGDKTHDAIFGNHLGYDARFVCPSLNFITEVMNTGGRTFECDTGLTE